MKAVVVLLIILAVFAKNSEPSRDEKRLLHHLLDNYNILERPVANDSEPVVVKIGLTLLQIIDLCEKSQILMTNAWLQMEWVDSNLKWNSSEFGNIADIRIPPHQVWKPDILLYNSADQAFDPTYPTNYVVKYDGNVSYIPPGIFRTSCKIDLTLFPYEEHKCEMKFGSWTYDGHSLDIVLQSEDGGDLSSFTSNSEWELLGLPAEKHKIYYACCPEPYVDVTFTLHLRRRGEGVLHTLMFQFVLISAISLFGFLLPVNTKAKLYLNLAAIFCIIFMINTVDTTMSVPLGHVPFFYKYFSALTIIVLLSILLSILILNFIANSKKADEIPQWIRVIFLKYIPAILFMTRVKLNDERKRGCELDEQYLVNQNSELSVIRSEIRVITDKLRKDQVQEDVSKDWIFAANVFNRLSLIILTIMTVIIIAAFLA